MPGSSGRADTPPIEKLKALIVEGSGDPAPVGRPSTLVQLTLCVNTPFDYKATRSLP